MVSQFLSLSKPPDPADTALVDVGAELGRVVQLVSRGAAGDTISFETDLPADPARVRADERALRQVFLNLLLNAMEAMEGRTGVVRTTLRERRGHVEIHVTDTGAGISPRDLPRVFEPFFTTKRMGTGLGLALTRGIVENLGGTIEIESEQGRGTVVTVVLPTASPDGKGAA
jgi:signal transduction histidine kinase